MNNLTDIKDAAIYVGTYKKYNEGSLFGKWMNLSDYADKDEFYKACRELHKDEDDPELMFQDWEYIPEGMCGESWVSARVWDLMNMDDDDIEILLHYCEASGKDIEDATDVEGLLEEARNCYVGYYETYSDLGYDEAECLNIPKCIDRYFDYEAFGRDCAYDYNESDGYYFDLNRI